MRESTCRGNVRDVIHEIRIEEARRMTSAPEQYENDARGGSREPLDEARDCRTTTCDGKTKTDFISETQASRGGATTASQEVSTFKTSIAKHELAYPFVCCVLVVERASRASDADQAKMMRRIHEET